MIRGVILPTMRVTALVHGSRWARWVWYILRLAILVAAGLTLVYFNEHPVFAAVGVALSLGLLLLVDRSQTFRVWACYVLGIVACTHLRTLADETFIATKYLYVIEVDRLLFAGTVPTVRLQERFHEPGTVSALDTLFLWTHLSYFIVPQIVAILAAVWSRTHFIRYVGSVLATIYLGLMIYFLVPTSPPWLASYDGFLPEVTRILQVVGTDVSAASYDRGHRVVGANDVAAMPSLHLATTVVIMLAFWRDHWIVRVATVAYTILMGVALVYLGEHYVFDLIVGFAVALAGWWIANHLIDRYLGEQIGRNSSQHS